MNDLVLDFAPPGDDADTLGSYAQRAYLEYALSVVKGRALPDVCDGMKPVQRRILYAMERMGLGYSGPNRNAAAKPVKSARVVGDDIRRVRCGWKGKKKGGDQKAHQRLSRKAINAARSSGGRLTTVSRWACASPPCQRIASSRLRARPSCRNCV